VGRCSLSCRQLVVGSGFSQPTTCAITFLKHWGPKAQSLEDTIQDLEDAFSREGFDLDPIEGLRETLLLEFVEKKLKDKKLTTTMRKILSASRKEEMKIKVL
jgi:hypothetical protein